MAPTLDTAAAVIFSGLPLPCEVLPKSFNRIPAVPMTAAISITIGSIPGLVSFSRSYILFRPIRWSTRQVNVGPRSVDTIKLNFIPVRFGNHRCRATSKACDPVVKPLRLGGAEQSAHIVGVIPAN